MIWIDARLPEAMEKALLAYGNVYRLHSRGIVYDAISGHPDIFMCKLQDRWVLAPNIPQYALDKFIMEGENWIFGSKPLGASYPHTSLYNIALSDEYALGNFKYTDSKLKEELSLRQNRNLIQVNQGYVRCNTLFLDSANVICSDRAIEKVLKNQCFTVLYIDPRSILLEGFSHGFLGGSCGIHLNKIFFTGSLSYLSQTDESALRNFLTERNLEIVELGNHPLIDGGGILFS